MTDDSADSDGLYLRLLRGCRALIGIAIVVVLLVRIAILAGFDPCIGEPKQEWQSAANNTTTPQYEPLIPTEPIVYVVGAIITVGVGISIAGYHRYKKNND